MLREKMAEARKRREKKLEEERQEEEDLAEVRRRSRREVPGESSFGEFSSSSRGPLERAREPKPEQRRKERRKKKRRKECLEHLLRYSGGAVRITPPQPKTPPKARVWPELARTPPPQPPRTRRRRKKRRSKSRRTRGSWPLRLQTACGSRTYLFSRCPSCIEQEDLDDRDRRARGRRSQRVCRPRPGVT